jgi:integrase
VTGRRRRVKVRAKTKAEAMAKLNAARDAHSRGATNGGAVTVGDFLDDWLAKVVPGRVGSENTIANYRAVVEKHLKPALGSTRVDRLRPEQVDRMLVAKAEAGLSRSYIGRMRTVLTDALRHAERRGLVARNAGALSVMPKTREAAERRSLTVEEARRLLGAAEGDRLEALVTVGVATGLRPGELTGLLWSDLDLDAEPATLTVSGSLKRRPDSSLYRGAVKRATAGMRTLALPASAVAALKAQRAAQGAEKAKAGDLWVDHGLIFASEVGTPIDPANLRKAFGRIAARAGLSGGFPYLLRHTTVSLLIDAGLGIEEVADLLGDDPRTLYRHYRHRVRPVAEAGLAMDRVLG